MVLVPGLQGRWEWMEPAVRALARRARVVAYSLCDEPTSGYRCAAGDGFDAYVRQLETVLDRAGLVRAVVVGVSYGGLIAAEFAATRPGRAAGLVLASALPPTWRPSRRDLFYMRHPWIGSPAFVLSAPLRLAPEVIAARRTPAGIVAFGVRHAWRLLTAPTSPARMAQRARRAAAHRFADLGQVRVPALVLTGEARLDRVVDPRLTCAYLRLLPQARAAVLPDTGHIGIVTRPEAFADLVVAFARECAVAAGAESGGRAAAGREAARRPLGAAAW